MSEEITFHPYQKRKRKKRSRKPKTPSRQAVERELWRVFSLFIRQRDGRCMMGEMWGGCQGPLQAGHVIGRRKKPTKYAEDNVFGQCAFHNKKHKYHPNLYVAWYVKTFGAAKYEDLVRRSEEPGKDLPIPVMEEMISRYSLAIE